LRVALFPLRRSLLGRRAKGLRDPLHWWGGWAHSSTTAQAVVPKMSATAQAVVPKPSTQQLRALFVGSAVPFIAFGIVDQSVLIWAGDAIDNTVGVYLGLPTLAAAAMGQVLSDTCGVTFGGTIEALCLKLGLPLPGLTDAQLRMGITKRVSTLGGVCGVITGCFIGMLNLLVVDLGAAERAKKAKELESITKTIMADGQVALSCERATLWIVDADKRELWSSVAQGVSKTLRVPLQEDTSVAAWVAKHNEVANIAEVLIDERWGGKALDVGSFVPRSMLCAPVVHGSEVVAVIQLMNKYDGDVPATFDHHDEKVLKILCSHVAIFLEQLS